MFKVRRVIDVGVVCLFAVCLSSCFEEKGPLVKEGTKADLTEYLEDISQWIIHLDVGSGKLKNTKEKAKESIFINGNFARVLIATYRITKKDVYLKEAIRWADQFVEKQVLVESSQGNKVGFWNDVGPNRNIYFGDTGTAAASLGVIFRYVDKERRQKYLQALERYAAFVMEGTKTDPQGRGREATTSWVITEGKDKGALGCGYYREELSTQPYSISTGTTGGGAFGVIYSLTEDEKYSEVAKNAVLWLSSIVKEDGEIPYVLHGKYHKQWPLDTISYAAEGFIAVDHYIKDEELRTELKQRLRPTVDWLLERQNKDGSWGKLRSPDQQRSPRVMSFLSWYYRDLEKDRKIRKAVEGYVEYLLNPENSKAHGVKELIRTTGFVGLAVADLIEHQSTF